MPALNPPDKPKYARGLAVLAATDLHAEVEFRIWHKLVALQPSKHPLTALAACGVRFEPDSFLYAERTLLDWAEDDDICDCAAEMPTEDQCKNQLATLRFGGTGEATAD
jgi:hypothetical protein